MVFGTQIDGMYDGTVVVVVGPIGFGKSSYSSRICKVLNEKFAEEGQKRAGAGACEDLFVHIDGDQLSFPGKGERQGKDSAAAGDKEDQALVMRLSQERGPYSMWCVLDKLHRGQIPVLSCGGGILFERGRGANADWTFLLRHYISEAFGPDCNVKVVAVLSDGRPLGEGDLNAASGKEKPIRGDFTWFPARRQAVIEAVN